MYCLIEMKTLSLSKSKTWRLFQIHDEKGDRMACCLIGWEHSPHDVADSHEAHGRAHGHGMDQTGKMQE